MRTAVVVSRNPSMAWGLSGDDFDIREIRPHQLDGWIDDPVDHEADLAVLDLGDPDLALDALTRLRAQARMVPIVIVASAVPGWDSPALQHLPGARLLPLPVTSASLRNAAEVLLSEQLTQRVSTPTDVDPLPEPDHAPVEPEASSSPPAQHVEDEQKKSDAMARAAALRLPRTPRTSSAVLDVRAGRVPTVPAPRPHAVPSLPERDAERPTAFTPPAATEPISAPGTLPASRTADTAVSLVRRLIARADELYGVVETADIIVRDAVEQTGADSAALLLPDGNRWRVTASVGLSGVERRFELTEDSWVVDSIARGRKGVIVEDTDVARRPFHRAPLSSRKHLLAAPITLVEGILLMARDGDPAFDEDSLVLLARIADEADLLLAAALDVRTLARKLAPMSDEG